MKTLTVEAAEPYQVHIGAGALHVLKEEYYSILDNSDKIGVIVDENVAEMHLDMFKSHLDKSWEVECKIIPSGEDAKTVETYMDCQSFLLERNFSRNSVIIAFGGGATGDLAGFVASTFMRGISFIQVPTTILAHDSAVGGKTAINHKLGKNMIGTFYQPTGVIFDTKFLGTLPEKEIRSGMAEVIKHAFISNKTWLDELLAVRDFSQISDKEMEMHLERGIAVKAAIVEEDEYEAGVRKYLNFGHTLAHAIEAVSGYGKITHGEAVSIGMAYALQMSNHEKFLPYIEWCKSNGYPLDVLVNLEFEELQGYMKKDKKTADGLLKFVLLQETGKPYMETVDNERAKNAYNVLCATIGEIHL